MTNFEKDLIDDTEETAKILGISKKEALALEFVAKQAFAAIVKNPQGEALFHVAAKHALGQIDKKMKDDLFACLN